MGGNSRGTYLPLSMHPILHLYTSPTSAVTPFLSATPFARGNSNRFTPTMALCRRRLSTVSTVPPRRSTLPHVNSEMEMGTAAVQIFQFSTNISSAVREPPERDIFHTGQRYSTRYLRDPGMNIHAYCSQRTPGTTLLQSEHSRFTPLHTKDTPCAFLGSSCTPSITASTQHRYQGETG